MIQGITVNDTMLAKYNAKLLDFNTGNCGFNNTYFNSDISLLFLQYKSSMSLRSIVITLEFMADNEYEVVKNISNFTAAVRDGSDIVLTDGFSYHCMLKSVDNPKRIIGSIYTVKFSFIGFRHKPAQQIVIESTKEIFVDGNYETDAIIKIAGTYTDLNMTISNDNFTDYYILTFKNGITIDGNAKKVTNTDGDNIYKDCDFFKFPRLSAGQNTITLSSTANTTISYIPIYF